MYDVEVSAVTRGELIELLNEDLSREVRAVTGYANSSRQLRESNEPALAACLKAYAEAEFAHAMTIVAQIDTLGGAPSLPPIPSVGGCMFEETVRNGLDNEDVVISRYQMRVRQCELLGEYSVAGAIRQILLQEQEQFLRLSTVLSDSSIANNLTFSM